MTATFPGTTVEVTRLQAGASKTLFDGIFAAGGITLSQVCALTGLEPYAVQNWVKRHFVPPPVGRLYAREHLARIMIINMLRECLQIERICGLIRIIGGAPNDPADDLIGFEELYHRYVDMLAEGEISLSEGCVHATAERAVEGFAAATPGARRKLVRIFEVMIYAHAAARLRHTAEERLAAIE